MQETESNIFLCSATVISWRIENGRGKFRLHFRRVVVPVAFDLLSWRTSLGGIQEEQEGPIVAKRAVQGRTHRKPVKGFVNNSRF